MNKRLFIVGVCCITLGFLAWGIITPAMIPGASSHDLSGRWQHIAERVSYMSAITGAIAGAGVALVIMAFAKPSK